MKRELRFGEAILPVAGISIGTANAAIKQTERDDVAVFSLAAGTVTGAVFTRNAFCAAPVVLGKRHLAAAAARALVINSGNANAGTGDAGVSDARAVCEAAAAALHCPVESVLPFSTGVIGERLPSAKIIAALPGLVANMTPNAWYDAARAIMTTDTEEKACSTLLDIGGGAYTVTGIAKGAGMIKPNMATMLAYIATDAAVAADAIDRLLATVVADTFNRITVDGDTSTNDSCVLMATGQAPGGERFDQGHPNWDDLVGGVRAVCAELAKAIARDGEGATKLVNIEVFGRDEDDCAKVAYTVAESPLVKTAMFAGDPNWGRILAAVGRAPVERLAIEAVSIWLDDCRIVDRGMADAAYDEAHAARIMASEVYTIRICIGSSTARVRVWTCDFSYDYVRINSDYRS